MHIISTVLMIVFPVVVSHPDCDLSTTPQGSGPKKSNVSGGRAGCGVGVGVEVYSMCQSVSWGFTANPTGGAGLAGGGRGFLGPEGSW